MTPTPSSDKPRPSQRPEPSGPSLFPELSRGERRSGPQAGRPSVPAVRALVGDSVEAEDWKDPLGDSPDLGGRARLREETGAALERQLLLSATQEETAVSNVPREGSRWIGRVLPWLLMAGIVGSGVFFFLESKKTWEEKVLGLESALQKARLDAETREGALRQASAEKDQEIEARKKDAERIASLADQTLQQLKVALADFRELREEKSQLEAEYRKLLRERESPILAVFGRWLPEWARQHTTVSGAGER